MAASRGRSAPRPRLSLRRVSAWTRTAVSPCALPRWSARRRWARKPTLRSDSPLRLARDRDQLRTRARPRTAGAIASRQEQAFRSRRRSLSLRTTSRCAGRHCCFRRNQRSATARPRRHSLSTRTICASWRALSRVPQRDAPSGLAARAPAVLPRRANAEPVPELAIVGLGEHEFSGFRRGGRLTRRRRACRAQRSAIGDGLLVRRRSSRPSVSSRP